MVPSRSSTVGYGIGLGAGGILAGDNAIPLDVGPNRNLGQALRKLAHSVTNRVSDQNLFITANFPKLLYKLGGKWVGEKRKGERT